MVTKYFIYFINTLDFSCVINQRTGAYVSENSTHYSLPDRAYFKQKSGPNTVNEWSEHRIKAIFELSTLDFLLVDINFKFYEFFNFLELSA